MQVQAMRLTRNHARYGATVVCAGCTTTRQFWKTGKSEGDNNENTAGSEPGEGKGSTKQPPPQKSKESTKAASGVIGSLVSGSLWKTYAEKAPIAPEPSKSDDLGKTPKDSSGANIVSSILSGKLWKASPTDDLSKAEPKVVANEKAAVASDKWFTDMEYYISKIPTQLLDNRMKESLQDFAKLGEGVYRKVDRKPEHPLFLNIALLRLYAKETHSDSSFLENSQNKADLAELSDEFAAEIVHYFRFAEEVYEADVTVVRQDIVLNQLEENEALHIPRHIVFLDHLTKSIVVAIRGTSSLHDVITDLYIEASPFLDASRQVYAHKGIAESAQAMLPSITTTINKIRNERRYADYYVVTTGHSLGAGSAALLAILLSTESKIAVECFAFAPPPIISKPDVHESRFPFDFMNSNASCVIHSFVHDRDFISRCSHKELLNMLSALTAIDALPWTDYERSSAVFRNKLTDEEKQQIRSVLEHERRPIVDGNDVALYVPGDIMLLRPVVSKEVISAQSLPPAPKTTEVAASDASAASTDSSGGYSLGGAWQRVKQTVSAQGSGVMSSSVTDTTPSAKEISAGQATESSAPRAAKNDTEKESERQREKLRLERLQYEVIAVPSADALFNGLLYYGDSMVTDHLITSYRRALLRMLK
mmetsp:Transcript_61457/g.107975  ORF Transcript_61457/g.107975 Transcript_61457/m.107975 type:complete len:650 (-) Transcript_61457:137-2086(-)